MGVVIVDIRNPHKPNAISRIKTSGQSQSITLSKDNRKLYVADNIGGVNIYDIRRLNQVKQLGHIKTHNAFAITLSNDEKTAFIADLFSGIRIVNIENPKNPRLLKTLKTGRAAERTILSSNQKTLFCADNSKGIKIIMLR